MAAKSIGIDMEQNYVTVTPCIDTNGIRELYTTSGAAIIGGTGGTRPPNILVGGRNGKCPPTDCPFS